MTTTWMTGDAMDCIRSIPDDSVDLVATSPPFLALRNYNDLDGQWGTEPHPGAFLDNLLALATEFGRVITEHGSIAVELGDTFAGSGGAGGDYNGNGLRDGQPAFAGSAARGRGGRASMVDKAVGGHHGGGDGWPLPKSLCGIPTLFAWSLAYGRNLLNPSHEFEPWRIRNVIVWARNNPPVGALADKFRPATSYITVATKSAKRWFDLDAVRGDPNPAHARPNSRFNTSASTGHPAGTRKIDRIVSTGAPPLDYWTDECDGDMSWLINSQPSNLAHYAMWPPELAQRLVLAMCPLEVCEQCSEPRRRVVDARPYELYGGKSGGVHSGNAGGSAVTGSTKFASERRTVGWSDCDHGNYRAGVVLDPFAGTGTTLACAELHGRRGIAIDLDPFNETLYPERLEECRRSLFDAPKQVVGQISLI